MDEVEDRYYLGGLGDFFLMLTRTESTEGVFSRVDRSYLLIVCDYHVIVAGAEKKSCYKPFS
jgi:hypothetical protein